MSHPNWKRVVFALVLIAILALGGLVGQAASVEPTHIPGASNTDKTCAVVMPGTIELKMDREPGAMDSESDGMLTVSVVKPSTLAGSENSIDWTSNISVLGVIVKNGVDGANWYDYRPGGSLGDNYLTTPSDGDKAISHVSFCYMPVEEELTVTKTAVTSFQREHLWNIAKGVETENEEFVNGTPKIWLDGPGDEGDETATWTIDVTYEGFEDSDFNVSGEIAIENTGSLAAVITSVDDVLGGTLIMVDCGAVEFPYTLPVGNSLVCSYSEDGYVEGSNVVTVTTERDTYSANATIVWGDPTNEINETVNIEDMSDLFGTEDLGPVTAPNGAQFTYTNDFAWEDYDDQCGANLEFENTATIVETGDSASAILKVNVRCEILDVSKTAETSFTREHFWDIDKSVETENEFELEDGTPKIWLFIDGSGNEKATWIVDVTYEGSFDSGWSVAGIITATNTGQLPAVITDVTDLLAGSKIEIDCGAVEFPYTLPVGNSLVCSYSEDGYVEGSNVVTVTTERDTYSANATIVWGDPTNEINETVNIEDMSDLFGTKDLGSVTAPDDAQFTYTKDFAWNEVLDCDGYQFDNTAEIVETEQSDSATLKVNVQCEILEVSKTVVTYWEREHFWDIAKNVETENQEFVNGTPKIWLYTDGTGNETATWLVDVTYKGFVDSGRNVSGEILIKNTGYSDAWIDSIIDKLAGVVIDLDCGVGFALPYLLPVGESLMCTYSEDGYVEGKNVVTVTTQENPMFGNEYTAEEPIIWSDPEEINKTVTIKDISDLFGEVELGMVTAPDDKQFTYTKDFAWADDAECGSFEYDNTAMIVETKQEADATLKVNVQCMLDDSAWAKGKDNFPFCGFFSNWGWTNRIMPGRYEWPLWAGAGQCDTDKAMLAGMVTVVYDVDGYVTVTFELYEGFTLGDTHVYAGYDMFPYLRNGRPTVAPGHYTNEGPFDGSQIYVIVHAVVYYPDPNFGP